MADPKDKDAKEAETKEGEPTYTPEQLATPPSCFPFDLLEPHGKGKTDADRKAEERKAETEHKPMSRR